MTVMMFLTPVLIMVAVLTVITILLMIADRLLVNYGECTVTVREPESEQSFTVEGGGTLLSALIDNGFKINSSCAGKATCGYCKVNVLKGGGDILPTEDIFMSREELEQHTRLSCQVKIKEDIELFVPDLITTVRSMAGAGRFDTSLNWKFLKTDKPELDPDGLHKLKLKKQERTDTAEIINKYRNQPGGIMPILQELNEAFGYLPEDVLRFVAVEMEITPADLFRIATFYNAFSLEPRGKNIITICMGTACHVKGAAEILGTFEDRLGIKQGETTDDRLFTIEPVRCIGCCGLAPVIMINDDVHGLMTKQKVTPLIDQYGKAAAHV